MCGVPSALVQFLARRRGPVAPTGRRVFVAMPRVCVRSVAGPLALIQVREVFALSRCCGIGTRAPRGGGLRPFLSFHFLALPGRNLKSHFSPAWWMARCEQRTGCVTRCTDCSVRPAGRMMRFHLNGPIKACAPGCPSLWRLREPRAWFSLSLFRPSRLLVPRRGPVRERAKGARVRFTLARPSTQISGFGPSGGCKLIHTSAADTRLWRTLGELLTKSLIIQ
ncbi:Hypothetical predicted protein [Olea europaea subsp. europaea]|uniref:Uncharacterized protein n=1 Tax=Olea europaea subsp. europaea TaxID=158383 RepID=A0A8S0VLB8_OLEEU|nr:Hypothetical predicted protein [Olea europaea subsp. europaea]